MRLAIFGVALAALLVGAGAKREQSPEQKPDSDSENMGVDVAAMSAALREAKVPLHAGIRLGSKDSIPLSANYELKEGKLLMAIYSVRGDDFLETIIDPKTGKAIMNGPITIDDDLMVVREQAKVITGSSHPLWEVVFRVERANQGFRAVSVIPEQGEQGPAAIVILLKGLELMAVEVAL
jgi:hypothetical protein